MSIVNIDHWVWNSLFLLGKDTLTHSATKSWSAWIVLIFRYYILLFFRLFALSCHVRKFWSLGICHLCWPVLTTLKDLLLFKLLGIPLRLDICLTLHKWFSSSHSDWLIRLTWVQRCRWFMIYLWSKRMIFSFVLVFLLLFFSFQIFHL